MIKRKYTLWQIAFGEHNIPGFRFLYFKIDSSTKNSWAIINSDNMVEIQRIPVPYKFHREHDPDKVVTCYYDAGDESERPKSQPYTPSRTERMAFLKTLAPEQNYGLAYKIAYK